MDASELLGHVRLVPVLVMDDVETAVPLAVTLRDAGLAAIEITLRTPTALAAIDRVVRQVPELLVGAGSVRHPRQLAEVAAAGAAFAVSPGATGALLEAAGAAGLPFVPGAATASEMLRTLEAGIRLQKFFPAEQLGGAETLRALSAPLPELRFFPTGGITEARLPAYLELEAVACIGGSWFVPSATLAAGAFDEIGRAAAAAVAATNA